jgi:hypothetical protein
MKAMRHFTIVITAVLSTAAHAQYTDGVVKIGILTDMSSLYSDGSGPGSVAAAKLAVADFNAAARGMKVEVISADHLNKPDVGSSLANSWFDVDKVDVIVDVPNSGIALAVSEIARQKKQGLPRVSRGRIRPYGAEVQLQYDPMDIRYLEPSQQYRQGDGNDRRRHLVFHHGRPCLRLGDGA